MKHLILFFLLLAFTFTASCQEQTDNNIDKEPVVETPNETPNETDSIYPPVETEAPNADYKPAFEGQTRINGVKTKTPYEMKVIAQGLSNPWAVASLPDGRLVITEKAGILRIATDRKSVV